MGNKRRNGPLNQTQSGLVAKEGEFVTADDGLPYSGKYYIQNGVAYAGNDSLEYFVPVPLDQVPENQFANLISTLGYATAAYTMAKQNFEMIKQTAEKIIPPKQIQKLSTSLEPRTGKSTFTQKTNDPNNIIKEIKPNALNNIVIESLRRDPLYKLVEIDFNSPTTTQQIEEGDKIIPGLKTFVNL
jgi:hypothetical protein